MRIWNAIDQGAAKLFPGYFAVVMATGIVSVAVYLLQVSLPIARLLFQINKVAYGLLWALTIVRLLRHFARAAADLADHTRGAGFFTVVAGTSILGSQFVILSKGTAAGTFFWLLALFLWLLVTYAFFTAAIIRERKPESADWINGGWLIAVVATQSISVLGILIAPDQAWQEIMLFLGLLMYLLGCMQYLLIESLIFYRLVFFPLAAEEFSPPYWINMGATAITTLAGAMLILQAPESAFLREIVPFLKGLTLFFWMIGTWWIPLLIVLEIWRYLYKRFPLRYDPRHWSLVFPIGMYTVCTFQLAKATGISFLLQISRYSVYIAMLVWLVILIGLIRRLMEYLFHLKSQPLAE